HNHCAPCRTGRSRRHAGRTDAAVRPAPWRACGTGARCCPTAGPTDRWDNASLHSCRESYHDRKPARRPVSRRPLTLRIPTKEDKILVQSAGQHPLPLESYGTGIHHLVIICAGLVSHTGGPVLIEEPEVHFHPELQRKFLRFIAEETNQTYFITTHSNVFLN